MRLFKTILLLTVLLWSTLLIGQTELVNQRTVYSKTFHLQGDQYKTVLSTVPLHYRGTDGQLREISEPAMQFLNQGRTPENGVMRTTSTSELSPSASGSYGEVDYTYPSVDAYYDEENMEWIYDTTYTDTTGYLTMSDAWTVTGQYYDDDMLYQLTSQSPGEVSEVDSIMNWRSLLSWNPSSLDIFSSGTFEFDSLDMTLSYWGALTESAFEVELRSMQTHSINTQAISDSEYTAVEDGALITTLNLQLTQQSLEEQTIRITSGPMYDDFEQVLNDQGDTYTIGLMHNSETYSNYDSPNSAPYVDAISGTIEIYYTIDSITLLNQRRNDPGSNLGGNLSLNHLAQADLDYLNITSGDTVFIFENQEYTVWTHDQWLEDDGTDVLHHDWNGNASDYTLEKANFSMPENINTLAANFDDPATVPISAPGGNLEIQDPWLSQNETDFTTITGGAHQVFLNQGDPGNPNSDAPYYRLRAPETVQYDETDWYFQRWQGSHINFGEGALTTDRRTTDVVFQSGDAEVEA